jgi:C4-dicarboxylate transporter DctM subunit
MAILLIFLVLLAITLINVPIAVGLGIVAVGAMIFSQGIASLPNLAVGMYNGATNFPLIAIPLFILAGAIMNASGISQRLIAFATAALGSILIPAMKKKGYSTALATSVVSSSATLAVIIPPSIPMILYAVMADTSVVRIFVAGIVPGLLGGIGLMLVAYRFARIYNLPVEQAFNLKEIRRTFREAIWAFILPIVILGTIFGGIVTATEGACMAVLAALFVGLFIYRELDLRHLKEAIIEGGVQTAVVMLLVGTSTLVGTYLTEMQAPQQLAGAIASLTSNKWVVLALLNVLFFILGLFLHSAAAIILTVPVVMPLVREVGIDPVHFGLIVTINLGIGQQTPPVASVLMTACAIAKADIWEVTRVNVWFVGVLIAVLLLCTYIPAIPLFLPNLLYD